MGTNADTAQPPSLLLRVLIGRKPKRTLVRIVVLVAVSVVVFKFVLVPIRVEGRSMLPTYNDHGVNFVNRLAYLLHEPRRGDVVAIGLEAGYHVMYMKRIVGLPGETVAFHQGHLYINGRVLDEPYVKLPGDWEHEPEQVGPDQYYVVGDNRECLGRGTSREGRNARSSSARSFYEKWLSRLLVTGVLVALGFWGWRVFFPSPEAMIRKRLSELAKAASFSSNDGLLAKAWNASILGEFFTPDVQVTLDVPGAQHTISGRDELLQAAVGARTAVSSLTIEFPDIKVIVAPDKELRSSISPPRARSRAKEIFTCRN